MLDCLVRRVCHVQLPPFATIVGVLHVGDFRVMLSSLEPLESLLLGRLPLSPLPPGPLLLPLLPGRLPLSPLPNGPLPLSPLPSLLPGPLSPFFPLPQNPLQLVVDAKQNTAGEIV